MLEVIALDADDAVAAQAGGAHRLELVTDMAADGLSPSPALVRSVLAATDLPVRVMLRDAPGFAPNSPDGLRRDAAALREAGASEFVLGFLDAKGWVDVAACTAVLGELRGCKWTFHRALDNSADPEAAWGVVAGLGCDTVLASGSPRGVAHGFAVLERLAARQDEVSLLVGGGLQPEHVAPLKAVGVTGFHVGSAVRPGGWAAPLSADAVRTWANLV
ncbi:copper homeostasis protein [Saccharothrix tamanrassetensis]|uniref:Copper homeostasis protein cutC homolog n=1 Tax=Saccharothrix tamanrassetensis TaxID=1051531 RepID=A0A841CHW4_9PSEU|nr:copper homeostasis protein CutC [Saccharothrix tamanrassetensis]MBB5956573.1 copper homeostasis protein [Saccharothrix tamanrassetensis]